MGEASHPGPPKELRQLRRVSSTHYDRGADDPDLTMRDSVDDAPLVRTQFAGVARGPPITVGGSFAAFVGSVDCEEFDLTIANGPEKMPADPGPETLLTFMSLRQSGKDSCLWTRLIWCPFSREERAS